MPSLSSRDLRTECTEHLTSLRVEAVPLTQPAADSKAQSPTVFREGWRGGERTWGTGQNSQAPQQSASWLTLPAPPACSVRISAHLSMS